MDCPGAPPPHSGRVLRRAIPGLILGLAALAPGPAGAAPPAAGPPTQALVDATRTSIYLGSVRLTLTPLRLGGGAFAADYAARVVPFLFFSEHGHLSIDFSDDQLGRLVRGETVEFKGRARSSSGAERRIEGRAVPAGPGTARGKIKVRVFVGKIQLIFNSAYRIEPAP